MEELRSGSAGPANPFIIGASRAQRFMKVMETVLRGRIASDQEADTAAPPVAVAASPVQSTRTCC
jgi:metallo-beta-lactamase class B